MNYLSELRVAGGKSYNNFYIDLAGGKNVANELGMFAVVGVEQILAWDPEVILLNGCLKMSTAILSWLILAPSRTAASTRCR